MEAFEVAQQAAHCRYPKTARVLMLPTWLMDCRNPDVTLGSRSNFESPLRPLRHNGSSSLDPDAEVRDSASMRGNTIELTQDEPY